MEKTGGIIIEIVGSLDEIQIQRLRHAIEISSEYLARGAEYLERVVVVPQEGLVYFVNALLSKDATSPEYQPGPDSGTAVAVPFITEQGLRSTVVLTAEALNWNVDDSIAPLQLHSTVLEEFLHVEQYASTWEKYAWLTPPTDAPKDSAFRGAAVKIIDEYWVTRTKAPILSGKYFYLNELGSPVPVYIWYGSDLAALFDKLPLVVSDDPQTTLEAVVRFVFEPIARDTGFRAGNTNERGEEGPPFPSSHPLYRAIIEDHANRMIGILDRFFHDEITKENAIYQIANMLEAFCANLDSYLHSRRDF